jgi:hypothetical protein
MKQDVRVAIIGESVLMEGIVINLEDDPSATVARVGVDPEAAVELVTSFRPHVIVYELGFPDMDVVLAHARSSCCVRLVVLDDNCNQVLVMDSRLFRSPTMADLQHLISFPVSDCPSDAGQPEVTIQIALGEAQTVGLDTLPT